MCGKCRVRVGAYCLFLIGRVLWGFHLSFFFLDFFKNSDFEMDSFSVLDISEVCKENMCFLLVKNRSL